MKGIFKIKENGEILVYENFEDIPLVFDHLIEFKPDYPDSPHTNEQHEYMVGFEDRLKDLMFRERKLKKWPHGA